MAIEAVIFDMDGVLVDSEVYWMNARVGFAEAVGRTWTVDDQRHAMGRNTVEWAAVMRERLNIDWPLDSIIADMKRRVIAQYEQRLPDRPGALASVQSVAKKYHVALASGSPIDIIQTVVKLTKLDEVFEAVIYGDDFPRGKPHPDVYLAACSAIGVAPEHCVGIEDSPSGIRAVKAAGMRCIAAPSPSFPLAPEIRELADAHIDSMELLTPELIASLG